MLIRIVFSEYVLVLGKDGVVRSGIFHIHRAEKIPFFLTIVQKSSEGDEEGSDTLKGDTVAYLYILVEEHESAYGVVYHEGDQEQGDPWGYDNRMIGKGQMCLGLEFFLYSAGEKQKTQNTVDENDDISDISDMDTECTALERVVLNREPVEEERDKGKKNTDTDNARAFREMQEIETQTSQNAVYFIF